jgi:hypothetical protein
MKAAIVVLALAAAAATSATASSLILSGLCDTGVVTGCASETPLAANTADGNYKVTVSPVGTPPFAADTIDFSAVGTYFTSGGNSFGTATADWITTEVGGADTQSTGTFNYQDTIIANVTGLVTITGSWAVDNCGTIAWGATPVAVSGGTGTTIGSGVGANCATSNATFDVLTPFSIQESVVSGTTYFLDFEVGNTGDVTALMVDSLAAAAAPLRARFRSRRRQY